MSKIVFADSTIQARKAYAVEWLTEPNHRVATNFAQGMMYLRAGYDVFFDLDGLTEHEIIVLSTEQIQEEFGRKLADYIDAEVRPEIKVGDRVHVLDADCEVRHPHGHRVVRVTADAADIETDGTRPPVRWALSNLKLALLDEVPC